MKEKWKLMAGRIDALTLRERVLLFAAMITLLVMLPYSFGIQPSLRKQQLLLERIRQDQSQIDAMQKEMRAIAEAQQDMPDTPARAKLEALEQRLAEVEQEISQKQQQLVPAERMPDLLRSVMGKGSPVEFLSVTSVAGGPASVPEAADAAAGESGALAQPLDIYKHGAEITVRGRYMDLLGYLSRLEKSEWRLLWGPLSLTVEKYPLVTLKATVFTLSTQPTVFKF